MLGGTLCLNHSLEKSMLHNPLIFSIGGVLAATYFLAPMLFASRTRPACYMLVALLYVFVLAITFLLADAKTAVAVAELGILFTAIGKLLAINFSMLQSPNYPKNRRCY